MQVSIRRIESPVSLDAHFSPRSQSTSGFKTSAERRLIAAEETQRELERELSQAKATISRLEADRRWLSEREQHEREERQQLESAWEAERVRELACPLPRALAYVLTGSYIGRTHGE